MDCAFNKLIPEETNTRIILRPTSKTFINGLASTYDTTYNPLLKDYITEKEYHYVVNKVVDELSMMWPCCFCFTYGYLFSICTLGLSFCFPNFCISEAKITLLKSIEDVNKSILNKKGLKLSYQQKCSASWLQIDVIEGREVVIKENKGAKGSKVEPLTNEEYLIRNQV